MLWRRHRKTEPSPEIKAASKALHKAEDDLESTRERNHEITTIVTQVTHHGEINHFAEKLREAFGGAK